MRDEQKAFTRFEGNGKNSKTHNAFPKGTQPVTNTPVPRKSFRFVIFAALNR